VDTMKTAGVAELKAKLSEHLALVKGGEEILVTDRGEPIARIVPVARDPGGEARLRALAARGLARLPLRSDPGKLISLPTVRLPKGALLRALDEDREDRV
jgi:prevent-host-death family protein